MATDPNKAATGATGGDEGDDQKQLTPEEKAAADAKAADEANRQRLDKTNKKLKSEIDELKTKNAEVEARLAEFDALKAKLTALEEAKADNKDKTADDAEIMKLRRDIADRDKAIAETTRKSDEKINALQTNLRSKAHRAAINLLITEAQLLEPAAAAELLQGKTRWNEESEQVVAVTKDEDGNEEEIPLKGKEALKKSGLLPLIFWPAEGVPGAGSRGTGVGGRGSVDVEKLLSTQSGFEKNKDVLRAEMRKRQAGG